MPRSPYTMKIRIEAEGARQTQGEVRQTAGAFDVVITKAERTEAAMRGAKDETKQFVMAARGVERIGGDLDKTGNAAGLTTRRVAAMNSELRQSGRGTDELNRGLRNADKNAASVANRAKELGGNLKTAATHAEKTYSVFKALQAKSPLKLFDALVPERVKTKIGLGMIGSGVGIGLGLGSTVAPAKTKQSQMAAITALAGNDEDVADDIYRTTDKYSTDSVFNLPDLVDASKTLTKDRQFSERFLKAVDDLAATEPGKFKPQEAARALGRVRVGDTGEGLERLNDMGLTKLDLKAKGIKFDNSGAVDDKTPEGITRLIDAIVSTIEERFGGLSEKLATTTLEGSVSNMEDAITRFKTSIGNEFIPVLTFGANTIKTFTTWLNGMPDGLKKFVAWGTAATGVLLVIGGGALILNRVVFAYKTLNFILALCGTSVGKLSLQMMTQLIPSLLRAGLAMALIAVIAWGVKTAIEGTADAAKMSNAELEYQWGIMGKIWIGISDFMNVVWNHPLLSWIHGNTKQKGDNAEEESLKITNARLKRLGRKQVTKAEQDAVGGREETVADVAKRREAEAKRKASGGALADWQKQQAAIFAQMNVSKGGGGGVPSFATGGKMSLGANEATLRGEQSADVQAAQARVDSLQSEVQALQDQKRGETDKELKKAIGEQIIAKQRLLQAAKRELAATKKLAGRGEKQASKVEDAEADEKFDRAKTQVEFGFDSKADDLNRALDKAKRENNAADIARATKALAQNNAQKLLRVALMEAERESDAQIRASLKRKAQFAYKMAIKQGDRDARNASIEAEAERQNTVKRGDADARKQENANATDGQVDALSEQLDAAKEAADFARIRSLTYQIESLRAEQEYADAMTEATLEENAEKRRQLERLAGIRKNGALAKAGFAADKAMRDAKKDGDASSDKGAREALARMNAATRGGGQLRNGGIYRPGGTMFDGVPSLANFGSTDDLKRERTAKVSSITQRANGNWKIKIEEIEIPYQGIGDAEVN